MAIPDSVEGGVQSDAVLRVSPAGRGPVDPRLLRRAAATRWYLAGGVLIGSVTAVLTVVQAWVLSRGIASVFAAAPGIEGEQAVPGTGAWPPLAPVVAVLVAVFAGKAALSWLNALLAHRAAAAVKSQLRREIMAARLSRPLDSPVSTAGLVSLVTQGLDALDGFYGKYLPQLVLAVTVPVIVGVAILTADLTSAVIVALTLPLIPVFMALVGWTTEARTAKRWRTQQRLARHFADLVAGLPTLQVFGRAQAQAIGLRRTEDAHRGETMGTLRISFLSALVLELLATLSVAVVAVTVGLRVAAGDLDLATSLFVLVLAPEAFLPVRQVGVHYHDAADGMAAAESAFALIGEPVVGSAGPPAVRDTPYSLANCPKSMEFRRIDGVLAQKDAPPPAHPPQDSPLAVIDGLGHTYPGADSAAVSDVSFAVHPGEFVALTGPSGGGKTTVLNALLGFVDPTAGRLRVAASDQQSWRRRIAYVGQHPGMIAGTIADNVRLGDPDATDAAVSQALARAGGTDLDPARGVGDDGEGLSAGERRRVATARALVRIDAGADLLLLDEPTAGLDADAESALLAGLRDARVAVVVVSHRPAVIAEADRVVVIGATP